MRRLVLTVAFLLALACAPAADPAPPSGATVRLLTWNVQDLFDTIDDPYSDEVPTEAEAREKMEAVGRVLRPLEADLLALQEVEKESVLLDLARGPLAGMGYRHVAFQEGNDSGRGIDVAFLSRVPVKGFRSHAGETLPAVPGAPQGYRFSRDCLEVHVDLPQPIVVLVNHFKSKAGRENSDAKRRAQALGVQRILAGLEGKAVAVVGDLNDRPDTWALAPLLRDGLTDVLGHLPEPQRASYTYGGRPIAIDYILVNEELAERVVPGSARTVRSAEVSAASDHSPVLVDLRGGGPSGAGESAR